jgi:hypothetical protein
MPREIRAMPREIRAMPKSVLHYDHAKTHKNSLFCDCSEHVEIDMTLLHSGMFGKCEIGHGPSIILLIL